MKKFVMVVVSALALSAQAVTPPRGGGVAMTAGDRIVIVGPQINIDPTKLTVDTGPTDPALCTPAVTNILFFNTTPGATFGLRYCDATNHYAPVGAAAGGCSISFSMGSYNGAFTSQWLTGQGNTGPGSTTNATINNSSITGGIAQFYLVFGADTQFASSQFDWPACFVPGNTTSIHLTAIGDGTATGTNPYAVSVVCPASGAAWTGALSMNAALTVMPTLAASATNGVAASASGLNTTGCTANGGANVLIQRAAGGYTAGSTSRVTRFSISQP